MTGSPPVVTLRYWGGARAAAGVTTETVAAGSVAEAVAAAVAARAGDDRFAVVMDRCAVLVDGVSVPRARWQEPLTAAATVELLPPFAGGSVSHNEMPSQDSVGPLVWDGRSPYGLEHVDDV